MPRLNIPATKINLIRIKDELKLAVDGHELLEQKRQVLIMEVRKLINNLRAERSEMEQLLREAYAKLAQATWENGAEQVALAGLATSQAIDISLRERSVMGIILPVVDATEAELRPSYSLSGTTSSLDEAARAFHGALQHIARLAELENAALRLATELMKTQRRVNALKNFFIPQYHETVKFLQETLEERERDSLFALKRLKSKADLPA
ncbi:MAG TPA: V-type ATP synthase subunit D [Candidatus Latescibacteria bacterium]|nr:MAG: V-type ATP synthase subunit D [Spirochaetes bacterium ADurb.Bin215]HPU84162.1 V-type ATP synthase subunit D [Candidatus Latescibacterota bacterium]